MVGVGCFLEVGVVSCGVEGVPLVVVCFFSFSSCKWLLLVSAVHPVAILSAWFCFVCRCVS